MMTNDFTFDELLLLRGALLMNSKDIRTNEKVDLFECDKKLYNLVNLYKKIDNYIKEFYE